MSRSRFGRLAASAAAALFAATGAFAGGPLVLFDPAAKIPYAWPDAAAPVYTDLGSLGPLSHEEADAMTAFSINEWNAVPTSAFTGTIGGDFGAIGLPDIDASNLGSVLGTWNGGGVHIVYDADGTIFDSIFGPFSGVLGVTVLEWVGDTQPDLLEVTLILNGNEVPTWVEPAEAATMYAGVVTHEFGHAVNLAHTQTNGQNIFFFDPWAGPAGCETPYAGAPSADDFDTMYPFTSLFATGVAGSTVDVTDDRSALSDIYPGPGWPGAYPSIRGTINVEARRHARRSVPVTGANVIARNVANPWKDAISGISAVGDGTYAFHGLTAGASYVVYTDGILAGAFSTPVPTVLPGPEEFWNGRLESGDGVKDERCEAAAIRPKTAGKVADITFNKVKGAPEFTPIDLPNSSIGDLSRDGRVAIGYSDAGLIRWTPERVDLIGGDYRSPQMAISSDGRFLVASTSDAEGNVVAGLWTGGQGWKPLGGLPGATSCDGNISSGWGVANDATVVGLAWHDCVLTDGFKWTPHGGMKSLGNLGSSDFGSSRANRISADASTIVGWDRDDFGFWRGAIWRNGVESIVRQPQAQCCDFDGCTVEDTGEASAVNPNGSIVIGDYYAIEKTYEDPKSGEVFHYCESTPWRLGRRSGLAESLGGYLPEFGLTTHAFDLSDDGRVIVGRADSFGFGGSVPLLWTQATGWLDFKAFLAAQGTYAEDWVAMSPGTISGDAKTIGGWAYSPFSRQGWIVHMPTVVICHAPPGNPANRKTMDVPWPSGLAPHLAHGDTIGQCGNGR